VRRIPRRWWLRVAPVVAGVLIALSLAAISSSGRHVNINQTAAVAVVNGVPDVTGVGNVHGSISLADLQATAGGATVRAAVVQSGGLSRGYLVIEPAVISGPLPMIVMLGGVDASPTQEAARDEFIPLAASGQAVIVYPAGYGDSWNIGVANCCGLAASAATDDIGFVKAVTLAVQASRPISKSFLVGFSNGGKLAYQVMCAAPELFSAIGAVGAAPLTTCASQAPRSMFLIVGAKDTELPIQGQTLAPDVVYNAALTTWRAYNSCTADVTRTGIATTVQTVWSNCAQGTRVEGVYYGGLDHEWPTTALVGPQVAGAVLMWAFFSGV
jgi:polyhydroxybutyrate depolymerase